MTSTPPAPLADRLVLETPDGRPVSLAGFPQASRQLLADMMAPQLGPDGDKGGVIVVKVDPEVIAEVLRDRRRQLTTVAKR